MNAGRDLQQLSACFVVPVEDSIEGIFQAVKITALIHQSGGGTGFSFSKIRPEGDIVKRTGGIASGPVSFMKSFDTATEVVKQGGTRRGANMGVLSVYHPDIVKFISVKEDGVSLQNFNISVGVDSAFMEKVILREDYGLVNPRSGTVVKEVNAGEIFDLICQMAWKTGDPGLVFLDKINEANVNFHLGRIECTNPCGEQPLLPYESCNLGSINLANMVEEGEVWWEKLNYTCRIAVHMLDNVIDMNRYPIPEIEEMTKKTRRIGVGVMGFADMLLQLGVRYDSEDGLNYARRVMDFIHKEVTDASLTLASKRGEYPEYKTGLPLRNSSPTTIAPTGTISIIAGCSSGIEPLFAVSFTKTVMDGTKLLEFSSYFIEAMEGRIPGIDSFSLSKEDLTKIRETGSIQEIKGIPQKVKDIFRTAHNISPEWHIKMQKAFQTFTDNAVSKTINMPSSATVENVRDCYLQAYQMELKGLTIFRDGCRDTQVLKLGVQNLETRVGHPLVKRPKVLVGTTNRVVTGHGTMYATINKDSDGQPVKVFLNLGKIGECTSTFTEALGRVLSTALSAGIGADVLANQLIGISCPHHVWNGQDSPILSVPDALGKSLLEAAGFKPSSFVEGTKNGNLCPECGYNLIHQEGCSKCLNCSYNECY